jgi:hypothetical protein
MMLVLGYNEPQVDLRVIRLWLWWYKIYYKLQGCYGIRCYSTFKPLTLNFVTLTVNIIECDAYCEQKVLLCILLQFETSDPSTIDNAQHR